MSTVLWPKWPRTWNSLHRSSWNKVFVFDCFKLEKIGSLKYGADWMIILGWVSVTCYQRVQCLHHKPYYHIRKLFFPFQITGEWDCMIHCRTVQTSRRTLTYICTKALSLFPLKFVELSYCCIGEHSFVKHTQQADSLHSFRCKLKTHLFTLCFNDWLTVFRLL